jgi:hypothetical protein
VIVNRRYAVVAAIAAALVLPIAASATVTQTTDTFTEETNFFQPNPCLGIQQTGTGTQTVTVTETDTPNGGVHVRGQITGSVALYAALGPGPWDPQPGRYLGTWTYHGTFTDEGSPSGRGATDGTQHGAFTFADGSTAMVTSEFHLTWGPDGPKLFFAHSTCGGK